ncbi:GNAT family N-acetyltransferase [Glutamicibacter sp.]|uniref:GNAT family N-acetyltransferase n=1 Tax=Glutamicibacter sp. TaxID=1931995 RepID=UPI0028BE5548|nr:GNAT family N-acetyltransferase [Glutamicibacter sp.]
MSNLETVTFNAHELPAAQQQLLTDFQISTSIGFYDDVAEAAGEQTYREIAAAHRLRCTMVFDRSAQAPSRHAAAPVHTYASFPGTLNAGGQHPVALHKISAVTVSPTHRRRGILSAQMRDDLAYAASQGFALAGLTASEATIYGRFGFDVASRQIRFTLKCAGGLKLRGQLPGSVVDIDPVQFTDQYRDLASRAQQATFGSVDGALYDEGYALGRWDGYETLAKPKQMRFAAAYDERGILDGFITYKFAGWDQDPARMVVHKLIAVNPAARIKLLSYVANHDLVEEVHASGPVDDPLLVLLEDPRSYSVRSLEDVLWLRILDVCKAFSQRGYQNQGTVVLDVEDDLGFAAGQFLFEVGTDSVDIRELGSGEKVRPEVSVFALSARELASLYLGTTSLERLLAVGRATHTQGSNVKNFAKLFDTTAEPFTLHGF